MCSFSFKNLKRVNFCRLSACWFTKDEHVQMYFSGILPILKERLYQETPFFFLFGLVLRMVLSM